MKVRGCCCPWEAALIPSPSPFPPSQVVFVGRTSNGKSTVINAMLHAEILPAGAGHTTDCFVTYAEWGVACLSTIKTPYPTPPSRRLIGTESDQAYLQVQGQTDKRDVTDVQSLAHALRNDSHEEAQLNVRRVAAALPHCNSPSRPLPPSLHPLD